MTERSAMDGLSPRIVRVLVRLYRLAGYECREAGLSLPQYRALCLIADGSRRAAEIADNAVVSRPAISVLIAGLEEQGLLRREPVVRGDRRGVHVAITTAGREALARVEERMVRVFGELLGRAGSVAELAEELRGLQEALDLDLDRDVRGRASREAEAGVE
jgi:DNA-binding MarR family transcriptional regulator